MGFFRQAYWSGLPCPPPGHFPSPGIEPRSPTLQVDSLPAEPPGNLSPEGSVSPSVVQRPASELPGVLVKNWGTNLRFVKPASLRVLEIYRYPRQFLCIYIYF